MPIYEYECEQCGVRFERLQRMTDASLTDCPECHGHIHRVMQPVGVIFKGSGFYVTDNRGKSSTGIPAPKHKEETSEAAAATSDSASAARSDNSEKARPTSEVKAGSKEGKDEAGW